MQQDLYEPVIQDAINNYPFINDNLRKQLEEEVCSFSKRLILHREESDNKYISFWNIEYFLELGLYGAKLSSKDKDFWKNWAKETFHKSSNSEKLNLFIDLKNHPCTYSEKGMFVQEGVIL